MEPEVREQIFSKLFLPPRKINRTGLGLWVSHQIILKHHGLVHVRSRSAVPTDPPSRNGHGTVFDIFLPDGATPAV